MNYRSRTRWHYRGSLRWLRIGRPFTKQKPLPWAVTKDFKTDGRRPGDRIADLCEIDVIGTVTGPNKTGRITETGPLEISAEHGHQFSAGYFVGCRGVGGCAQLDNAVSEGN